MSSLAPLPYHRDIRRWLETQEPGLWSWFASDAIEEAYVDGVRLELLKATYRLDRDKHAAQYAAAEGAAERLGIDAPVTLYHAGGGAEANASLIFLPGEVHVVLFGPVVDNLSPAEMMALMGHELAHYRLWCDDGGAYWTAMRLVDAIASDPGAQPSHLETDRRLRLYTEVYADRGALLAAGELEAVIACLVKVRSGLAEVSPAAYLAQAEEVLRRGAEGGDGQTHPETYVRARAIQMFAETGDDADAALPSLVAGAVRLDRLDLLDQERLQRQTRRVVEALLGAPWADSDAIRAHARAFLAGSDAPPRAETVSLAGVHASVAEYFAYVLLDFATVDPELGDVGLAAAASQASVLGIPRAFEEVARKELRLGKAQYQRVVDTADALLQQAARQSSGRS